MSDATAASIDGGVEAGASHFPVDIACIPDIVSQASVARPGMQQSLKIFGETGRLHHETAKTVQRQIGL